MIKLPPNILNAYFPLWGAEFKSKDRGLIGGSVSLMIPYMDEWRLIQESDVWKERFRHFSGDHIDHEHARIGPGPQPCLVVASSLVADEMFVDGVERLKAQVVEEARDAVLALRLFKPGWFIDPEMGEYAFVQKPRIVRSSGPYYQAFMESIPEELPSRYRIKIEQLSTHKGAQSPVFRVWTLVEQYNHIAHHTTADIAIENFNRSYGFKLKGTQRAAFLFAACDALLGGMNTDRIGRLKLKSQFRERLFASLDSIQEMSAGADYTPLEMAQWMDTFGRRIQKAIAHGASEDVSAQANESWEYIQHIVRLLLRQYLEFSIRWFKNPEIMSARLGLTDTVAPAIGYNLALELKARNGVDIDDLLRFEVSVDG